MQNVSTFIYIYNYKDFVTESLRYKIKYIICL